MEPILGLIVAAVAASIAFFFIFERRRVQLRVWC
jgi:hypothetical protein